MRSQVLSNRMNLLKKASSLSILAALVASCSSGFQRFDYSAAVPQAGSNQQASAQPAYNPYPENVDTITTASVGRNYNRRLAPLNDVAPPVYAQPAYNHQAEPRYAVPNASYQTPQPYQAPQTYQPAPQYQTPQYQAPQQIARQPLNTYAPTTPQATYEKPSAPTWKAGNISRSSLDRPSPAQVAKSTISKPVFIKPKTTPAEKTIAKTVQKAPAYVAPKPQALPEVAYKAPVTVDRQTTASISAETAASRPDGWTSTGGTTISVREGETLYNLSKRYGVPVSAIQQANNMSTADGLRSGQRVVIPNYVFSPSAPVSAPDNNPGTRAARASTGYQGEANLGAITVPTPRPQHVASLSTKIKTKSDIQAPVKKQAAVVQPQKKIDPVVTNSTKPKAANTGVAEVDTTSKAPARTGISEFRWPVQGRVVSKFGEHGSNGANEGIDISVPEGTAVKAAENGVVIYAGSEISTYGNLVLIRHADGWVSAYAHNREFNVKKGDRVSRGQTVARSGRTGSADRPKLHFELRKESSPVDPRKYLAG